MIIRVALVIVALVSAMPRDALASEADKQRLQQLLKKKYGTSSRSTGARGTRSLRRAPKKDLYLIEPSGKVRPVEGSNERRSATRGGTLKGSATGKLGSVISKWRRLRAGRLSNDGAKSDAHDRLAEVIINRKMIVVQLRPSTTDAEIEALIAKYKLNVIDVVPSLGALYVEFPDSFESAPQTQSIAPYKSERVTGLLEPTIVLKLRAEKAVNSAFVRSTIRENFLPQRSNLQIKAGQRSFNWDWQTDATTDGNWGLKAMRMPAVWTILSRVRASRDRSSVPHVAVLDSGFGQHKQLKFVNVVGGLPTVPLLPNCGNSHGTHVAGIIGASAMLNGNGGWINGIVPGAQLDAIPISKDLMLEGAKAGGDSSQIHLAYFADVIRDLAEYFDAYPLKKAERRVVNVSLAYNWAWVGQAGANDPITDQSVRNQVLQHANFVQYLVNRVGDQALFIAAAGNDSGQLDEPLNAELATPFGFAALHSSTFFKPSRNILIVEAHDRRNARADFSNVGGHVSAPGINIMSTFASKDQPFGVCSGTSQATPHIAALAAILFELKPDATPAEVIKAITASSISGTESAEAPRADALAAVLSLSDGHLRHLADLNSDGAVDARDLTMFKSGLTAIVSSRFGGVIKTDLNGDGSVDEYERCWPFIDLNGSGRASFDPSDKRLIGGVLRSDLEVLQAAWTDSKQSFREALNESKLAELIDVWRATALTAAHPATRQAQPCQ